MAKFSEVINKRSLEDEDFDPKYFTVRDTTGGLTDALYTNRGIDALGGVNAIPSWMSAEGVEYTDRATVPGYKDIISLIPDLKDDAGVKEGRKGARTALQKFVEDFPKMQNQWKKDLLAKDQSLGERGWETVKDVWKQTVADYYDAQAKKLREEAVDDGTVSGWVTRTLFPRMTDAVREGRDIGGKEIAGDVFQNLAYMVPAGFAAAPVKFAASRILPAAAQGAAKTAASFASQAAAPVAVYGADKALGNETTLLDPTVGTLGNMGANKVLFPMIGRMAGRFTGSIRNPQLLGIKALMEGADTPKERGMRLVQEKRQFLKDADRKPSEIIERAMKQGTNENFTKDALTDAMYVDQIGEIVKSPDINRNVSHVIHTSKPGENSSQTAAKAVIKTAAEELNVAESEASRALAIAESKNAKPSELLKIQEKYQPKIDRAQMTRDALSQDKFQDIVKVFDNHPELKPMLFKDKYPRLLDLGAAYSINKFADLSSRPAEAAANAYGIPLNEWKEEDAAERAESKRQSDLTKILNAGSLTEQDKAYLADIKANPELVVTGYPDLKQNNDFKTWLLQRGHGLLRGTSASRPTWEVE